MSVPPSEPVQPGLIVARLDAEDRIRSADEPLLRLQKAVGGAADGVLAVPQIVTVARLARRLGLLIARPLLIGGPAGDVRLWARALPLEDGGVELKLSEWQEAEPATGPDCTAQRTADIVLALEGAEWRSDAALRLIAGDDGVAPSGLAIGEELGALFADLEPGASSLAAALAGQRAFFGLPARRRADGIVVRLSGYPLLDADGSFLGFRGKVAVEEEADAGEGKAIAPGTVGGPAPEAAPAGAAEEPRTLLPDFGKRLDRALRQPLGRIIANAETISGQVEGPIRGDYAAYASDIASAGRHLLELVDDLADLQAIDRVNFTVAREDIDLADLARRAAGLLGVKAADRSIAIVAPAVGESVPAIGEFRRALQIIVNLLNNAIRYSPEGSTIWLRAEVEGPLAQLVVADQGRGIAAEDQQRIFDKFERLGRDDAAGSGLGLYISRRLARAMNGDLVVDSAPGQGARFVLTLPVGTIIPDMLP